MFKSTDGGENWAITGLTNAEVWDVAIDPTTPTTLYAGTWYDGVYKSTDGGGSVRGEPGDGAKEIRSSGILSEV